MSVRPLLRFLAAVIVVLAASAPAASAHVFFSFGFPFFPFWGPAYYYPPAPAYYYPPPAYYPPQQGYSAPNAYAQPAPQSAPAQTVAPSASNNCRTYKGNATIDSSGKPFYGRACLEADGRWHVVQQ